MATLALTRFGGVKRSSASSDDDYLPKKIRIMLESDSSLSSSDEAESIYSLQNNETATPHDTSDTSEETEFEVQSLSEVTLSEVSSGPEDCIVGSLSSIVEELGSEYIADMSDTHSSGEDKKSRTAPWPCVKCKGQCEYPFRFCSTCYRKKRVFLPPRPKGRKRKTHGSSSPERGSSFDVAEVSTLGSQGSQGSISEGSQEALEGTTCSSQEIKPAVCKCCLSNPIDGAFIHKNTIHPMYCYKCSIKQWRLRGRCPLCNQRLSKVGKIFPVD